MNIKKISIAIVALIIIIFVFAYISDSSIIDPLLSEGLKKERALKRAERYFPDTIGTYSLIPVVRSKEKVEIRDSCYKIENNPILKATGKTGDVCMGITSATYSKIVASTTATTTSTIQKVNLSLFTKSADMMKLLVEKSANPDTFEGKSVFRTAPFRLGWLPESKFNMIVVEEGTQTVSSTTITIRQEGQAIGDNDVFRYFISKYPPPNNK